MFSAIEVNDSVINRILVQILEDALTLDQLEVLESIDRLGSFSAAARRLGRDFCRQLRHQVLEALDVSLQSQWPSG